MARLSVLSAMITGAASGFGHGVAEGMAAEGAAVLVTDINGDGAAEVAADLSAMGARAEAATVDITDPESLTLGIAQPEAAFGMLSTIGRMPKPADVGAAAVFLAAPGEAGILTGVALPLDAGRTI